MYLGISKRRSRDVSCQLLRRMATETDGILMMWIALTVSVCVGVRRRARGRYVDWGYLCEAGQSRERERGDQLILLTSCLM